MVGNSRDEVATIKRINHAAGGEEKKLHINASEQPTLKVAIKHIKLNL